MLQQPPVKPVTQWSPWWVSMWVLIVADLLTAAFFLDVYDWMTVAAFEFGIPEAFGTQKQDDRFPPLTHVIVRYVPTEVAIPLLYGFAGAIGSHWLGFPRPLWVGGLVGLIGWLDAHFLPRFLNK